MANLGRQGMTMAVVTHEMGFARRVADQVVFMDEGRVVEAGTPQQIFDSPQSERLKRFLAEVL
jgi:polar amino acid transport system permease protein